MPTLPHRKGGSTPPADNPLLAVVNDTLRTLSPRAKSGMIRLLSTWSSLKPERRALLAKLLVNDLPDGVVAEIAELHRSTLLRKPSYKRLKALLPHTPGLPRGSVDGDGAILEAWLE